MRGWGRTPGIVSFGILLAALAAIQVPAADTNPAAAADRVGVVAALSASPDGSFQEETGNCVLWTVGNVTYTIADLHTVMAGDEGASDRVADQIKVQVGKRSSRARLVWPPQGRRDVLELDIAILELEERALGQPFGPEAFQGRDDGLPKDLYLAAPAHRSRMLPIHAPAVARGSQWFIYRELSHGDSGGMVFTLEGDEIVPYGFVSSIGSLPGESNRGTAVYGRHAMGVFIKQFLDARRRVAGR